MPQLLYNSTQPEFLSLDFNEIVLDSARKGTLPGHIFLVPTARAVRELGRRLTREYHRTAERPLTHLPIYTIDSFAHEFYGRLGTQRRIVSSEVSLLLIEQAMKTVDLNYYARGNRTPSPGVVEGIARVISGIRADGILPSDFQRDIQSAQRRPDDPQYAKYDLDKLGDLYNIYGEYLRLLGSKWIDYPGQLLAVNTALFNDRDAILRKAFPGLRHLLVHGFTELTEPETSLFLQLGQIRDLEVMIYFDYAKENGPLYGNFSHVMEKLKTVYNDRDLDPLQTDVPESERRPFKHHMRKNLFRTDEHIPNAAFNSMVTGYGFYDRAEEAQGVAALIKSLTQHQDIAPERICVTTMNMDPYTELFREQLASHGIPSNITARFPLERNALVTALFAALSIVAGNYDRRDVLRAVTSPYLNFGKDVDPAAMTEVSGKLRITRGRSTWTRRIERRLSFLNDRLSGMVTDADDQASIRREASTLRRALNSFNTVAGLLQQFNQPMTPSGFQTAFLALVSQLGAVRNILQLRHDLDSRSRLPADWQRVHDEIERDTRALAELTLLLDELTEYYETSFVPENGTPDQTVYPLEFYLDRLYTACARSVYQIREKNDYGVLVTPVKQLQGLDFDVVIVCGLIDGEFPSIYMPEVFLGKPLENSEDRTLRRERMEFYQAITAFEQHLYFTYPRFRGDAELVRSPFLEAFLRITTAEENDCVHLLDGLEGIRRNLRSKDEIPSHLRFLTFMDTFDALAAEAGTVLWNGGQVPRVNEADAMLDNLRHTAHIEALRQRARSEPALAEGAEYRGRIADALSETESAALETRRDREYSISQLELYAKCPFKFFASRILHVNAPSDYDVTLTPLERGVLIHSVLFNLYTELRGQNALPITAENRDAAVRRAQQIAAEEISGISFDHPYWTIDQERLLGGEVFGGLLEAWIDAEVTRGEEKSVLTPEFFEASFGRQRVDASVDKSISVNEAVTMHEVNVRGKVDRIEIYRRGDEVLFAVADYKTGQPPSRTDVREGLSLQLMIYMEVVRSLLSEHYSLPLEKVRPVGGVYYKLDARNILSEDKYMFVPEEMKTDVIKTRRDRNDPKTVEELEDIITGAFAHAAEYVQGITGGAFHVTTRDVSKVCRGCDYHAVCRVNR